jgi:phospholipase/carboxylesterase
MNDLASPLRLGAEPGAADAAVVLVHGRGGSAEGIAEFVSVLDRPRTVWVAPRARGGSWYPNSFLAPLEANQPWLDAALGTLRRTVDDLKRIDGVDSERIMFLGFSQGACLATEFVAREAGRWGGLAALSGGLIGPPDSPLTRGASLDGTKAFFGCGVPDPHIPRERVEESGRIFEDLGADVDVRLYPGLGHSVNADELRAVNRILEEL